LRRVAGEWQGGSVVAALLISLREGLEAALIIGIVLGYVVRTGQGEHVRSVWAGVLAAIVTSVLIALGIQAVGAELEGRAEGIFEGTTMLLAVGLLTWMIFWMRAQARGLKGTLEKEVQAASVSGHAWAVSGVVFLAVFREGVETALFLSASAFAADGGGTLAGAVLGLGLAAALGWFLFASTVRLDLRLFFTLTSVLLLLFAAGLLAHGVHEFQEVGLLPLTIEHVWDTNALLDESSLPGELLSALFGYNGNPSLLEVISYATYWGLVLTGLRNWSNRLAARARGALAH
jgi:high-affinity iron transporter